MGKVCSKCGVEKPLDHFYKRSERPSGYQSHCKTCNGGDTKPKNFSHTWYQERFTTEELKLFSKLKNLCTKAKLRDKQFDPKVDWEYLFDLWVNQNGLCAISGLPLTIETNHPHTVSLDRIDSDEGYVVGNLQLVSFTINRIKLDMPLEDFVEVCGIITDNQRKKTT